MWESRSDFQGGGETRRVLPSPSFPPPFPPPASFFFEARRPQLLKEFALGLGHDLPLRDLIDGVDVIHTFGPRLIALVHGVDPQIAGLALRIGPPPLANRYRRELGFAVVETAFAVAWLLPQVVQVGHRDRGQPLVFALAVLLIRALQNGPRGLVSGTAAGAEPAPPSRKPAGDFRLRTGLFRWLLEKPRSAPGSASLLRARWLSILSMPPAPGSSCIGNRLLLQAHLVLEKTCRTREMD